jgi:hypothetical protein
MRSKLTLMTTAAVLALGLSGAAYAADTGAPRGDGIKESEASEATTQKTHKDGSMSGAGSMQGGGDNSADQGGTGVKASSDSEGATNKSTDDPGAMGMNEGKSSGNAPGGTGVETSSESEGAKNKTTNE